MGGAGSAAAGLTETQGIYARPGQAVACASPELAGARRRRDMLTCTSGASDNANMCSLPSPPAAASRAAIRELASRHGLEAVRWWPPNDGDLLVEGLPQSLRQLRADLERALGCKVAIYLADCLARETRDRLRRETVDLLGPC
jgi:hypothetical protein